MFWPHPEPQQARRNPPQHRKRVEQFEKKWLHQADSLTEEVLSVPDFSTTADLYGVVHNIDDIRVIPVGALNLYAIVIVALIPALPVVIATIPFDTLIHAAMGLLF